MPRSFASDQACQARQAGQASSKEASEQILVLALVTTDFFTQPRWADFEGQQVL